MQSKLNSRGEVTQGHTQTRCTLWFVAQVDEITESIVTLAAERRGGLEKSLRKSQQCVHEGILSFSVTPGLQEPHKLSVYKKCWRF